MESISLLLWFAMMFLIAFFTFWLGISWIKKGRDHIDKVIGKYQNIISFICALFTAAGLIQNGMPELLKNYLLERVIKEDVKKKNREYFTKIDQHDPYHSFVKVKRDKNDLEFQFGVKKNVKYSFKGAISGFPVGGHDLHKVQGSSELLQDMIIFIEGACRGAPKENIDIDVFGQADGIPSSHQFYQGKYGKIKNLIYYSYDTNDYKVGNLIPYITKLSNEDYALMRALEIITILRANSPHLQDTEVDIYTKMVDSIGPEHRMVMVNIRIKKVFDKNPEKMGFIERFIF